MPKKSCPEDSHPIVRWCRKHKKTYGDLGKLIARSEGAVRNYVRGHRDPSLKICGLMYMISNGEISPTELALKAAKAQQTHGKP